MTDATPSHAQDMDPDRFRDDYGHIPVHERVPRDGDEDDGPTSPVFGPRSTGVLRASRAYLFPEPMRTGLETALGEMYLLTMDEAIHDLAEHPVLALARAILADLEHTLHVIPELEQLVHAGSVGEHETAALKAVKEVEADLKPRVQALRQVVGE